MSQSEIVKHMTELYSYNDEMIANHRTYPHYHYEHELQSNTINSHSKDEHEWFVLRRMLSANSNQSQHIYNGHEYISNEIISNNTNMHHNNNSNNELLSNNISPYTPHAHNTQPIYTNNSFIDYHNHNNTN
eukprot:470067_1